MWIFHYFQTFCRLNNSLINHTFPIATYASTKLRVWLNYWPGDQSVTIICVLIIATVYYWIRFETVADSSGSLGDQSSEHYLFLHPVSSSVLFLVALSLNERLCPPTSSIQPSCRLHSHTGWLSDPAGYNDDKSAQIFMSIEFHFASAHGSLFALFFYGSLCGSHRTRSQTVVIALHKHPSAMVMSPKHQWLLMSTENQVYGWQRAGINIEAYSVLM